MPADHDVSVRAMSKAASRASQVTIPVLVDPEVLVIVVELEAVEAVVDVLVPAAVVLEVVEPPPPVPSSSPQPASVSAATNPTHKNEVVCMTLPLATSMPGLRPVIHAARG